MGFGIMVGLSVISMLVLSTFQLDLDELQDLADNQETNNEDEEEFVDTSTLGWLDTDESETNFDLLRNAFPSSATEPEQEPETTAIETVETDDADSVPPTEFDAQHALWPFSENEKDTEQADELAGPAVNDALDETIHVLDFNPEEDLLALAFDPEFVEDGAQMPPEISIKHFNDHTTVEVNGQPTNLALKNGLPLEGLTAASISLFAA